MVRRNNFGLWIVALLCLVPIIIWILMQPLNSRFSGFAASMTSFGELTALVGSVLLGISFILSTRIRFLGKLFGGLDKIYRTHHLVGALSFSLLVLHPLFLAIKFWTFSASAAISFLIPNGDLTINLGIFALLVMISALVFTFLVRLKYERWKFTHQFLGLALLLAIMHISLITSDISRNFILKYYILAFALTGLLSFVYRVFLARWLVKKYEFRIKEIRQTRNVVNIILDGKINFKAGQFAFVKFPSISREFHPFSITSSPDGKNLSFVIKVLGDFTEEITKLREGERAIVEGPYGNLSSDFAEQIWIAGGIGITPFLSMAKSTKAKVDLYYCVRNSEDAIFYDELKDIAAEKQNLKVILIVSSETGHIKAEVVKKDARLENKEIIICGPGKMMNFLKRDFIKLGVKRENIILEEFSFL